MGLGVGVGVGVCRLLLVVAAEAAHEVARAPAARVGVGSLDVAAHVLEGVLVKEVLVRLQQ